MIAMGADDYNWIAAKAAQGGHEGIVNDMIARGANNYRWIASRARLYRHYDIARTLGY